MNSTELAAALARQAGMPEYKAREAVRIVTGQIKAVLHEGGSVSLPGLGRFEARERKAREYVNPRNKAQVVKAQRRIIVGFKSAKGLWDNPPNVIENLPPPPPKWAGHVWAVGVRDFVGLSEVDMRTFTAASRGRVDASSSLPNSLTVAAVTLDQDKDLSTLDMTVIGARMTQGQGGEARFRVSLWGLVNGVMQEQAAMMVDAGADSAQTGAMYFWSVEARVRVSASGTAVMWSMDWPGQVRPQAVKQPLVWPDRLASVELRIGYVPAVAALDLPALADSAKTHWAEVRGGALELSEI